MQQHRRPAVHLASHPGRQLFSSRDNPMPIGSRTPWVDCPCRGLWASCLETHNLAWYFGRLLLAYLDSMIRRTRMIYVDKNAGTDWREIQGFTPREVELVELVKFWAQEAIQYDFWQAEY